MDIDKLIQDTIKTVVPICVPDVYEGEKPEFCMYNYIEEPVFGGDDLPVTIRYVVAIHWVFQWSPFITTTQAVKKKKLAIKRALAAADFTYPTVRDISDDQAAHFVFEAVIIGGEVNAQGIEGLALSMQEFAEIPDEVVEEILEAGGKVVVDYHKREIAAMGLVKTGKLQGSIKAISKAGSVRNGWNRYVLVYPAGQHGQRHRRAVTKQYKRSKHGRTYTVGGDVKAVPNSEVGFIQEYGAPKRGIAAKHWMAQANEAAEDAVSAAEFEVYDRWLKSLNL